MSYYDEDDDFDFGYDDDIFGDLWDGYDYEDDPLGDNLTRCQCCEEVVDKLIPFNGNKLCFECIDESKAESDYADHHMRSNKQDCWDD